MAVVSHELGKTRDSSDSAKAFVVQGDGVTLRLSSSEEIELESISIRRAQEKPWGSVEAFSLRPDGLAFKNPAEVRIDPSSLNLPPGTDAGSLRIALLENGNLYDGYLPEVHHDYDEYTL